jgi:hypothetical protein
MALLKEMLMVLEVAHGGGSYDDRIAADRLQRRWGSLIQLSLLNLCLSRISHELLGGDMVMCAMSHLKDPMGSLASIHTIFI